MEHAKNLRSIDFHFRKNKNKYKVVQWMEGLTISYNAHLHARTKILRIIDFHFKENAELVLGCKINGMEKAKILYKPVASM